MIRLLLYSDAPIVAAGLTSLLRGTDGFELASVCPSLQQLHGAVAAVEPHIVLMDFTSDLPPDILSQIDTALLRRSVILWVYEIPADMAMHAMSMGVRGILRSTLAPDLVLRCLQKVQQGELWFEKALLDENMEARKSGLTGREMQLIRLLGMGFKNREIADALSITHGTVKVYLSRLFQKLGVKDRFEVALYGMRNPGAGSFHVPRAGSATSERQRPEFQKPEFD